MDSDVAVKAKVRARDGFRCRGCGISEQEYTAKSGMTFDVHRILPGCEYREETSITLCRQCHGKKPKSIEDMFWRAQDYDAESDIRLVVYNMTNAADRELWHRVKEEADRFANGNIGLMTDELLRRGLNALHPEYSI
jgi:DnaJ-class molecular chaperone